MNIGRKLRRQTGGASIAEYALLIGLLGTTALVAISQVGGTAGNGIEHAGQVIAENAGSKKGHPGQGNPGNPGNGNPGNGNPGNGNPGNGNPGDGDPGDGGNQPEPVTTVAPDQSFDFDGYVGPGETVGTVITEGEPPKGFELVSGGGGLQIDDSGRITIVDPGAFGPVETTKSVTVRVIPVSGPAAEGVIEVKRSTPVDLANDATTKGRVIVGTPKKNDIGAGDAGDWFAIDTETAGNLHILAWADGHSGEAMHLPTVTLRDAAGRTLSSSGELFTNLGAVLHNGLPAGKYFIQVAPVARTGKPGGYVIETAFVDDQGTQISTAGEIAFGSTVAGTLIYGDLGDMYKVEVPRKTTVRFMTDSQAGATDSSYAALSVFDASGKRITNALGSSWTAFAAALVNDMEPGTYYVRVDVPTGKYKHDYHLSVTEHADDERSSIQTDRVLELTELYTDTALNVRAKPQRGSVIMGDPSDWYRMEVDERTDIQVHIDNVSGTRTSFSVGLRDSKGSIVQSSTGDTYAQGDNGNRFLFRNVAPGTYFISAARVPDYSRSENQYDISARKIVDTADTTAQALYYDLGSVRGRIDYGETFDIYRFTARSNGPHKLRLHGLEGANAPQGNILDASGKTLRIVNGSGTVDLVSGQDYFVQIINHSKGDYGFSFHVDTGWIYEFPEFPMDVERSIFDPLVK